MAKLYSINLRVYATAYIIASGPEEARALAESDLVGAVFEVREDRHADPAIFGGDYGPDMPDVSLSPAMSIDGIEADEVPELVEEFDHPDDEDEEGDEEDEDGEDA